MCNRVRPYLGYDIGIVMWPV
ncbi:hypothetical protein F383_38414 [Gossypium arboreum]|uniref:Uncharacterized protein n=1 Tax=Gossypium arboreum TaxID=29729 RepID=A0A0B0MEY7_GOSAR|nr:hypothetical protein F383_38414 [Gossypium arboreum]